MTVQRTTEEYNAHSLLFFSVFSGTLPRSRFNLEGSGHQNQLRYKPTETFQYKHYTCFHSPGVKRGFIKGDAIVACVASVSVWFRSNERSWKGIFGYDCSRNETRTKKWKRGRGRGKNETFADKPSILKTCIRQRTQRLIGSVSRTILTCVDQSLFHTERSCMVRDTHLNFLQLMFILVQGKSIFFNFFWNAKVFPTLPRSLTCANFRVVFDSCSSFFAPWTAQKRLLRRLTQYDCLEQTL